MHQEIDSLPHGNTLYVGYTDSFQDAEETFPHSVVIFVLGKQIQKSNFLQKLVPVLKIYWPASKHYLEGHMLPAGGSLPIPELSCYRPRRLVISLIWKMFDKQQDRSNCMTQFFFSTLYLCLFTFCHFFMLLVHLNALI